MGFPMGIPMGMGMGNDFSTWENPWEFRRGKPMGIPTGNLVGMGWEWEWKFLSHGNPGLIPMYLHYKRNEFDWSAQFVTYLGEV